MKIAAENVTTHLPNFPRKRNIGPGDAACELHEAAAVCLWWETRLPLKVMWLGTACLVLCDTLPETLLTRVQPGESMSFLGLTYRNRNDSKAFNCAKGHLSMVTAH